MHEYLFKLDFICDNFLSSDANNNSSLRNVVSLSQLESKLGYQIAENTFSIVPTMTSYHPEVIIPIAASMYKCHIMYINHEKLRTDFNFHDSQTKKVITYKFKDTIDMKPKVDIATLLAGYQVFSKPPNSIRQVKIVALTGMVMFSHDHHTLLYPP
jgi:hypothetical protein